MKNNKKVITLSLLMSALLITMGVTFAFFTYMKKGTTENTITTGTVKFIYIEKDKVGAGIQIENAYPMSDTLGKAQSDSNQVFNFKIESETMSDVSIPFEVTARVKEGSTLPSDVVKIYLTEVEGVDETEVLLDNYSNLPQTSQALAESNIEKVIYTDTVPANSTYEKNFKLRMWIDEGTNFSPVKDENDNDTYPYNDKTFAVTVNVYSNGKVVIPPTPRKLNEAVLEDNQLITATPDLSSSFDNTSDQSGLYSSTDTNSGEATYYFRGNVTNNNVKFAGLDWKIVRVNEDGTIKLILSDNVDTDGIFNSYFRVKNAMYYSNSNLKVSVDSWYNDNISPYGKYVSYQDYCEQARVAASSSYIQDSESEMIVKDLYTPTFKCENDSNGYSSIRSKVALLTYDETMYAGYHYQRSVSKDNFLYNGKNFALMTPAGDGGSSNPYAYVWYGIDYISYAGTSSSSYGGKRPVISLISDTLVTGIGTNDDPYKVIVSDSDNTDNGSLYVDVPTSLNIKIMSNKILNTTPNLTDFAVNSNEDGIYISTATNSGNPTYYYRGGGLNNYVKFAGYTWRIIRINEDGTVRVILNDIIEPTNKSFHDYSSTLTVNDMYYSNSTIKEIIDNWYATSLQAYDSKIAVGSFCEQAKVADTSTHLTGSGADMILYSSYTPNFKCGTDKNGHGIINEKIGLITYDELIFAGGYYNNKENNSIYLSTYYSRGYDDTNFWTMSPAGNYAGSSYNDPYVWAIRYSGRMETLSATSNDNIRPVINLNKDLLVTGTGTISDPFIVQ